MLIAEIFGIMETPVRCALECCSAGLACDKVIAGIYTAQYLFGGVYSANHFVSFDEETGRDSRRLCLFGGFNVRAF